MSPHIRLQRNLHPQIPVLPFATSRVVLRAVYDEVNRLRVLGKRTKAERADAKALLKAFDDFEYAEVTPITNPDIAPRAAMCIALGNTPMVADWFCRVFDDWTLYTGLSSWRVYDGRPIVNAAELTWQTTVKPAIKVWPYAWHWHETYQRAICADGGAGREQDRQDFADEFK